jgi:hypothetical protein
MRRFVPIALGLLQPLSALTIEIDYSYDSSNFFDTLEKRNAIEAVARFYGERLQDNLLRIDPADFSQASWRARLTDPATGGTVEIMNPVIPEDHIIVYVGARNLGGSTKGTAGPGGFAASGFSEWFERIRGRGSSGAAIEDSSLQTDFSLWGGSIAFDIDSTWNFSLEGNAPGTEFLKIALHEMGHVLGLGTAATWDNQIFNGTFTGAAAINSYGSPPPADFSHFQNPSLSTDLLSPQYGSFDTQHGTPSPVVMLPSSLDSGSNFEVLTDLDLAALVDIGWEVALPVSVDFSALSPEEATFSWNSSSLDSYQIERGDDLLSFPNGSGELSGDGLVQTWSDPAPPMDKAFYRLTSSSLFNPTPASARPAKSAESKPRVFRSIEEEVRMIDDCFCDEH